MVVVAAGFVSVERTVEAGAIGSALVVGISKADAGALFVVSVFDGADVRLLFVVSVFDGSDTRLLFIVSVFDVSDTGGLPVVSVLEVPDTGVSFKLLLFSSITFSPLSWFVNMYYIIGTSYL